uniref:Ribonuclease, RNase K b n=1 Tax=Oncorhynchus kisutch TaxID=8019 RepID=A0A8C7JUT1_ONCKI
MPSLLFCGPKMAACGIVISIWGVIMLVMLGIFFSAKSAVLIEDVPFTEEDIRNDKNPPGTIYGLYNQVGINCFIAAAIYVAVGAVSLCQGHLVIARNWLNGQHYSFRFSSLDLHTNSG